MQNSEIQNLSAELDSVFDDSKTQYKTITKQVYDPVSEQMLQTEERVKIIDPIAFHKENREKFKIDVKEDIPAPQIAWAMKNQSNDKEVILGTLGDFGLIIGKAKARKSFFINIAVSAALTEDLILNRFKSYLPAKKKDVVYFDTEQSKYYVQKAVKRICVQINKEEPENLHVFHLRSLSPSERLNFIECEIYSNDKIGFVVIDGIKDLITSINNEEEASMIATKLLKWTEEKNIYVLTVLHQNKSDTNARGHIGTELQNKAQTVLTIAKAEGDGDISLVTPDKCRDKEPEIFAFEIDENGIPIIAENFEIRTSTAKNKFDPTDMEDYKIYQLLTTIFSKVKSISYSELQEQLQLLYKSNFQKKLTDKSTKQLITLSRNNGWVHQIKERAPYTLGEYKTLIQDDDFNF